VRILQTLFTLECARHLRNDNALYTTSQKKTVWSEKGEIRNTSLLQQSINGNKPSSQLKLLAGNLPYNYPSAAV